MAYSCVVGRAAVLQLLSRWTLYMQRCVMQRCATGVVQSRVAQDVIHRSSKCMAEVRAVGACLCEMVCMVGAYRGASTLTATAGLTTRVTQVTGERWPGNPPDIHKP
jgi:hypothetical protein